MGHIYFFADTNFRRVKIGYAGNVRNRFHNIQVAHWDELGIYDWAPATRDDEARLHELFAPLHIRGEWFRMSDEVFEFVEGFEEYRRDLFERELFDPDEHETEADIWRALDEVPIAPFLAGATWEQLKSATNGGGHA